jgi:hypothetical protein
MTGKISLRNYNGHVGEIMAYVCAMNKLIPLAPNVAVTWGWGSHDLLADLGNNAMPTTKNVYKLNLKILNERILIYCIV